MILTLTNFNRFVNVNIDL